MKKVIIIGCPGSGKSTLARQLHKVTKIPLVYLDMLFWNADKTRVSKEEFRAKLNKELVRESWIIDGNYGSTMELRMSACDTIIFLDYPTEICLDGIKARRGKPREDMPWVENEDEIDEEFIEFIKNYNTDSRPKVLELLTKHSDKKIYVFKSREEADLFLDEYTK